MQTRTSGEAAVPDRYIGGLQKLKGTRGISEVAVRVHVQMSIDNSILYWGA